MKKTMVYAMTALSTMAISIGAQAGVMLDKAEPTKSFTPWKTVSQESYQAYINYSGSGFVNLANKSVLFPAVPTLYFIVPVYDSDKKKTGQVKSEAAGDTWEKIEGSLLDVDNGGKKFEVTATSEIGIKNTVTVVATPGSIVSQCKVEAIDAPEARGYGYDTAILNYFKLESIPFTASLENGETVSGDLCTDFKPVKGVKTLVLTVDKKDFKIEFEGLIVSISPRNSPTVAAGISMAPVIKGGTLMPNGSFSYMIKISVPGGAVKSE